MADSISILKDWSRSSKISKVSFGEDGALKFGDVSLPSAEAVQVATGGDKTCNYTIGSIFLQLLDVNQSLLAYRKACKKHQVKDAIKVSDKAEIIAFFKGSSGAAAPPESGATAATETTSEVASRLTSAGASSQPPTRDRDRDRERDRHHDKKEQRSSSDREKDRHRKDSSSKKRIRSKTPTSRPPSSDRKEKAHKTIDQREMPSRPNCTKHYPQRALGRSPPRSLPNSITRIQWPTKFPSGTLLPFSRQGRERIYLVF
jgi:hypothetical protein